jgi:hypothetical protein
MARAIRGLLGPAASGYPLEVPHAATQTPGWREQVKSKRVTRYGYRAGLFLLGLLVILACLGLWTFLPAPLAIPPMLIGVWIWSTEFSFADSLLRWLKDRAQAAREYAKKHPVWFGLTTAGGFLGAAGAYWAFFQLV